MGVISLAIRRSRNKNTPKRVFLFKSPWAGRDSNPRSRKARRLQRRVIDRSTTCPISQCVVIIIEISTLAKSDPKEAGNTTRFLSVRSYRVRLNKRADFDKIAPTPP
ncbi:MAG: hypothetical protein G01um10143_24 [Parcubacteria group bacterium Gr01-1014_3]|nr:MAG: hypothetical protein G01um10143_24 [Parcubacteria group bacterium Gr01-1014_3]